MIKTLITYMPFYRIHEIEEYFIRNINIIKPKNAIVYIDNIFTEKQKKMLAKVVPDGIEIITGNWRDRNSCVLTIIKDAVEHGDDALIVDSDNEIWPGLQDLDGELVDKYGFYTILDEEAFRSESEWRRFSRRTVRLGVVVLGEREIEVYGYKIAGRGKGIYFIGPKQGIRLSPWLLKHVDADFLDKLTKALEGVEPHVRNYISDETTLGMLLYYSGVRTTPFIIWSNHRHHGSTPHKEWPLLKLLVATAHARLGRELIKIRRDYRAIWYFLRYKSSQIYNYIYVLLLK